MQPWRHWNDRCYRTVKSLYPDVKLERVGTHHNAVDDAESQARHLIAMLGGQAQ
jgi:exodeoxyribonuclease VIII